MNRFIKALSAVSLVVASASASAAPITVGGITWDPNSTGGISAGFNFVQWYTTDAYGTNGGVSILTTDTAVDPSTPGAQLSGVGEIDEIFSTRGPTTTFDPNFCSACELTFSFGGLVADGVVNGELVFDTTDAWLNVYMDTDPDFGNFTNPIASDYSDAQDGTLWASFEFDFFNLEGTVHGGEAEAGLSITGGTAFDALNYSENGSDITFTGGAIFEDDNPYSVVGNGQLRSAIPEPTSLALLGLGLLGFGTASRRKAK